MRNATVTNRTCSTATKTRYKAFLCPLCTSHSYPATVLWMLPATVTQLRSIIAPPTPHLQSFVVLAAGLVLTGWVALPLPSGPVQQKVAIHFTSVVAAFCRLLKCYATVWHVAVTVRHRWILCPCTIRLRGESHPRGTLHSVAFHVVLTKQAPKLARAH